MKVVFPVEPVPRRDDDVPLETLRPRRRRVRQLAFGDAVGPVGKIFYRGGAHLVDQRIEHRLARLSRLNAAEPRLFGIRELAEREGHVGRECARRLLSELVAADAAVRFQRVEQSLRVSFAGMLLLPSNSAASGIFSIEYQ